MTDLQEIKIVAQTLVTSNERLAESCNDDLYNKMESQRIYLEAARIAQIILDSIESIERREVKEEVAI